jgi:LysR family transcriptional regulator, nitrogen assimilation regulatory protein
MELKQLDYFVRVAQMGSFTRASIVLAVAQPALSKQIRRLEVELRHTLFNRNGRGISLTEEGVLFLDHAKGILEQVDRARNALNSRRGTPTGKVVIATPPTTGQALTSSFITAFRSRFPAATLEIIEEKSRVIYEWLLMGRIDVGILFDPPASPQLEIAKLKGHPLYLISPARHSRLSRTARIRFRDLAKFPLILPSLSHSTRSLVETEAAKAGIQLNVTLEVEGASFILPLVARGLGHTILLGSSLERSNYAHSLQANTIVQPSLERVLQVAITAQRPVTRLTRETVELIRQHLGAAHEARAGRR